MKVCNSIKILMFSLAFTIMLSLSVDGADMLFRFCNNDHDVLIIGQIENIDDEQIYAKVLDRIVSKSDINVGAKKEQLIVDNVSIKRDNLSGIEFNVGDYILASLDKKGDSFVRANGIYKIDSANKDTLVILEPEILVSQNKAVECFIHSDGTITEFFFEYDRALYRDENGNGVLIYDPEEEKTIRNNVDVKGDTIIDVEDGELVEEGVTIKNIMPALIAIIILFITIILYRTFIIGKKRK